MQFIVLSDFYLQKQTLNRPELFVLKYLRPVKCKHFLHALKRSGNLAKESNSVELVAFFEVNLEVFQVNFKSFLRDRD